MYSFSTYIQSITQKRVSETMSSSEIYMWLPGWLDHCIDQVRFLGSKKLITPQAARQIEERLVFWLNCSHKHLQGEVTFALIDSFYKRLIQVILIQITLSPERFEILGGYPFDSHVSGVAIKVQLIKEELNFKSWPICYSFVGNDSNKVSIDRVKECLKEHSWIKKHLNEMNCKIDDAIDFNKPHAEAIWLFQHINSLLEELQEADFKSLPALDDEFPQSQMMRTHRLEIITSSSCCNQCRLLFIALRRHLNELGIFLPMIFYADAPYNINTKHIELPGSVYVLGDKNGFIELDIQCNTPHSKYRTTSPFPHEYVPNMLTTKKQRDFRLLSAIGGLVMLDLLKVSPKFSREKINPITYLAPDSVIIFAAMHMTSSISEKLRKNLRYLDRELANIDGQELTFWRAGFTDYLHYMLVAEQEPHYRKVALEHELCAHLGFTFSEVDTNDSMSEKKFYQAFKYVWQNLSDLKKTYLQMLKYFGSYKLMPLGAFVGPLSIAMIMNMDLKWKEALLESIPSKFLGYYEKNLKVEEIEEDCDINTNDNAKHDDNLVVSGFFKNSQKRKNIHDTTHIENHNVVKPNK